MRRAEAAIPDSDFSNQELWSYCPKARALSRVAVLSKIRDGLENAEERRSQRRGISAIFVPLRCEFTLPTRMHEELGGIHPLPAREYPTRVAVQACYTSGRIAIHFVGDTDLFQETEAGNAKELVMHVSSDGSGELRRV